MFARSLPRSRTYSTRAVFPSSSSAGLPEGQSFHVIEREGDQLSASPVSPPAVTATRSMARDDSGALFGAADGREVRRVSLHGTELSFEVLSQPEFEDFQPFWLHVGDAFVVLTSGRGLVRAGTRTATSGIVWEAEPLYDFEHDNSIGVGSGGLVALENGEIRRFDLELGTWDSLGKTGFSQPLYVITATEDGFVFGGGTGLLSFYFDDGGYCPLEAAGYSGVRAPLETVRVLAPFGRGVLAAGGTVAEGSQSVAWIRPRW